MDNFWSLLRESTILQAMLTIGLWGTIIYMAVCGLEIPEILTAGGYSILGFWFGTKSAEAVMRAAKVNG